MGYSSFFVDILFMQIFCITVFKFCITVFLQTVISNKHRFKICKAVVNVSFCLKKIAKDCYMY